MKNRAETDFFYLREKLQPQALFIMHEVSTLLSYVYDALLMLLISIYNIQIINPENLGTIHAFGISKLIGDVLSNNPALDYKAWLITVQDLRD